MPEVDAETLQKLRARKGQSPGPGAYSPERCKPRDAKNITFGARETISFQNKTPGPGAYNISPSVYTTGGVPSFGARTRLETTKQSTPAPNKYSPSRQDSPVRNFTFKGRIPEPEGTKVTISPQRYSPQRKPDGPSFSLGPGFAALESVKVRKEVSPAPNQYGTPNYKAGQASSLNNFQLHPSIAPKGSPLRERDQMPGPGHYDTDRKKDAAKAATIGHRYIQEVGTL